MSEYQRYEFMTCDRPLTREQLNAVNKLSSHIEASSTHALIEYSWGDFKHNPIDVLYKFFDGFLYWANWGTPELAFRFPHGALPDDLLAGYDLGEFVTFTKHQDYDTLDIHFGEMEGPDDWTEYELGSLIPLREELMQGDLRALYIVWLASQPMDYDDEEDEEDEEDGEDEEDKDEESTSVPPVPLAFGMLTEAQEALAELLQVPEEMLAAAAQHSKAGIPSKGDNFVAWVKLLPQDRRDDYLVRLAHNEPGLSSLLVRELRELGQDKTRVAAPTGERVPYATLLDESEVMRAKLERQRREEERLARQRHLKDIHDHQADNWHQVDLAVMRGTGTGYDEATRLLVELRDAAEQFKETQEFQARFRSWVLPHLRRPAFLKRLQDRNFPLPQT
jgi:hypothetical protein